MVYVYDLPEELHSDIAEHLEYDKPTLYNLTLVWCRWQSIAEKLHYRHDESLTRRSTDVVRWSSAAGAGRLPVCAADRCLPHCSHPIFVTPICS
jgi:hypothetical protein